MTKRALISVSDKAGIVEFAQELKKLGWDIISTGGTKVALDNAGVNSIMPALSETLIKAFFVILFLFL